MQESLSLHGRTLIFKGKIEVESRDNGLLTLQSDNEGNQPSITISGINHAARIYLSPDRLAQALGWTPLGQVGNQILTSQQKMTMLAALRFFQSHGGALDADVQHFLKEEEQQAPTADQVDDLARLIYQGRRVVVYPWIGPDWPRDLPPVFTGSAPAMYVQVVDGGVDPILIGPFDTDDARDEAAEIAYAKYGPEATILWLNDDNGALTTGAYATHDFEEEDDA